MERPVSQSADSERINRTAAGAAAAAAAAAAAGSGLLLRYRNCRNRMRRRGGGGGGGSEEVVSEVVKFLTQTGLGPDADRPGVGIDGFLWRQQRCSSIGRN